MSSSVGELAPLIPVSVRDAVGIVRAWLHDNGDVVDVNYADTLHALTSLEAMPTSHPEYDPLVVVHYFYDGSAGEFSDKCVTKLSDYLLVHAANPDFWYYGILGKHRATAREFDVRWADGDNDSFINQDYTWKFNENNRISHSDHVSKELLEAAGEFLELHGPFDRVVADIPYGFDDIYENIIANHPYAVLLTFSDTYKTFPRGVFGSSVETQNRSLSIGFNNAAEAAVLHTTRSSLMVREYRWGGSDDDGNPLNPVREQRLITIAQSSACEVEEQHKNTAWRGRSSETTWVPSAQECAWITDVIAATSSNPHAPFSDYLTHAQRICRDCAKRKREDE